MKTEHPNSSHLIPSGNQAATVSTPRMDPAIKARWVAALRSGEYKQGRAMLRQPDNSFCCLGVLCNLHAQAHPEIASQQAYPSLYMNQKNYPAAEVQKWACLDSPNPRVKINDIRDAIALHNDAGRTFAEIADAIEAQL